MQKTKVRYYVDLVSNETGQTVATVHNSYNSDEAYDVAAYWNKYMLGEYGAFSSTHLTAEVYEIEEDIEEEDEMKKYTLKDYKEFCNEALTTPPFEAFDDGTSDEEDWFSSHKIQIIANNCVMELDYDADAVNEIDYALREIHEAILGSGEAITGNTFGSEYRPSELKDVVRYFIMCRYENWGGLNWFDYANQAVVEMCDIKSVIGVYEQARKIEKNIDFECNWHNFKLESLKDATEEGIKKIILDWVGSNIEISYDEHTDKSFIIDYTFKESGDFIDWAWGKINENEKQTLLEGYKAQIFEN